MTYFIWYIYIATTVSTQKWQEPYENPWIFYYFQIWSVIDIYIHYIYVSASSYEFVLPLENNYFRMNDVSDWFFTHVAAQSVLPFESCTA